MHHITTKHIKKHCADETTARIVSLLLIQRLLIAGMAFSSIALKAPVRNYIQRQLFDQAACLVFSTRNVVGRHFRCAPIHLLPSHNEASSESDNPFDACWKASSQSVNPEGDPHIDDILSALHSPAPQSYYVIQRALSLTDNEGFEGTEFDVDFVEKQLLACSYLLKPGRCFVLRESIQSIDPLEPSSYYYWSAADPSSIPAGWRVIGTVPHTSTSPSVKALANQALELVLNASERQQPVEETSFQEILERLQKRLHLTLGTDLRGQTSAEVAFALSLAGARDERTYQTLVHIACLELERVGHRPSQRPKYVRHMVEKLAASGVRADHPNVQRLYKLATECLTRHNGESFTRCLIELNRENPLDLLAAPPSLWLWRYSSRLRKPRQTNESLPHKDTSQLLKMQWNELFQNPHVPLIIDVGCGMGKCLLGLASSDTPLVFPNHQGRGNIISLSQCNFLGVDLNHATLRYASGIAHRWNLTGRVAFVHQSSDDLIRAVLATYPGSVALVLVHYPTPYRLPTANQDRGGNSQLPDSADEGFMISDAWMEGIATLLRQRSHRGGGGGYLLLQSNCEDVAITLRDRALAHGFQVVPVDRAAVLTLPFPGDDDDDDDDDDTASRISNRTVEWVRRGGERPIGPEWSAVPLLPPRCTTETEVACTVQGTPVHRCLLRVVP